MSRNLDEPKKRDFLVGTVGAVADPDGEDRGVGSDPLHATDESRPEAVYGKSILADALTFAVLRRRRESRQ